MKIYEALYNPCVHESGDVTISIHKTKKGALEAIKKHKAKKKKEFDKLWNKKEDKPLLKYIKFGQHEGWGITETELLT